MTDHPIIFSAPMVRALLDGRKTMTRRLAWRTVERKRPVHPSVRFAQVPTVGATVMPGDRLWVRETYFYCTGSCDTIYAADGHILKNVVGTLHPKRLRWTPSIHMPRWASRLTLTVTATKIERLNDISEADAEAEGVFRHVAIHSLDKVFRSERGSVAVKYFRELWDSLHGVGSWAVNPEVVALSFTVEQRNIDVIKEAA